MHRLHGNILNSDSELLLTVQRGSGVFLVLAAFRLQSLQYSPGRHRKCIHSNPGGMIYSIGKCR